ncbi:MAG TPA: prenyltransferase/squalene oxidase repeat-containing protein [Actinocrinis sp.]|nr:prenyltransferase/squalene oxidase repeat-containing protein [Actinocrinis sp.]
MTSSDVARSEQQGAALALDAGLAAAHKALSALQRDDGSWAGMLSASAVATGSAVIALHRHDPVANADWIEAGCRWLRAAQDEAGGWGDDVGAPATVNATGIAMAALAVADPGESAAAIAAAGKRIEAFGGTAVFADKRQCTLRGVVQHYLADAGHYPREKIARTPLELVLMPAALRRRLSFTLPGVFSWGLWHSRSRGGIGHRLLVRAAEPRVLDYLEQLQSFEDHRGGFEESPLMTSCVAYALIRARVAPSMVARCVDYLHKTMRADGSWSVDRDMDVSVTGFVSVALADADPESPELIRALSFLRSAQRPEPFPATGCPGGGWGWSLPSGWPNSGDTGATMLALHALGVTPNDPALRAGASWLTAMQNKDGSWGCFTRNAKISLDAPCVVLTADAVTALHRAGAVPVSDGRIRRAIAWFGTAQRSDGAFPGSQWYTGDVVGTAHALRMFADLGAPRHPVARRAQRWLRAAAGADGGWGSVEETGWALIALLAAADPGDSELIENGARWLLDAQRADGRWDPAMVGVYFLDVRYAYDHFADALALRALAACREAGHHV